MDGNFVVATCCFVMFKRNITRIKIMIITIMILDNSTKNQPSDFGALQVLHTQTRSTRVRVVPREKVPTLDELLLPLRHCPRDVKPLLLRLPDLDEYPDVDDQPTTRETATSRI